jgi:hypothetical protein
MEVSLQERAMELELDPIRKIWHPNSQVYKPTHNAAHILKLDRF